MAKKRTLEVDELTPPCDAVKSLDYQQNVDTDDDIISCFFLGLKILKKGSVPK